MEQNDQRTRLDSERRKADRRVNKDKDSPVICLPSAENQWDNDGPVDAQHQRDRAMAVSKARNQPTEDRQVTDNSTMDDRPNKKNLTKEEQQRLASLKSMLDASHARYQQATRNRRPVFAAGLEVKVIKGDYEGQIGIVLDADYIENRALISLASQDSPKWIGFRSLGHAD